MFKMIPVVKIMHTSNPRNESCLDTFKFLNVIDVGGVPEWTAVFKQTSDHGLIKGKHDVWRTGEEHTEYPCCFLSSIVSYSSNVR